MSNLSIDVFMDEVMEKVKTVIEDHVTISKTIVLKNNSVRYHGLIINKEDNNVSPTIYVDSLYKGYLEGMTIDEVVYEIIEIFYCHNNKVSDVLIDLDSWMVFENVKEKVFIKVVNYERNKELLEDHPYMRYLDLAVTFHIYVEGILESQGSVKINNDLMERWGITVEELFEWARANNKKLFPVIVKPMDEMLMDLMDKGYFENNYESEATNEEICDIMNNDGMMPEMYVMTNSCRVNGAVAIVYEEVIEEFASKHNGNIVFLPSSVHEVICITNVDSQDYLHLARMVKEVNITQIMPEEVLSDNIYIYNEDTKLLECYEW